MRKIDADAVMEQLNDVESLEDKMIEAAKEEDSTVTGAVVKAALKLFKNMMDMAQTVD